jgi:hypothetical protein
MPKPKSKKKPLSLQQKLNRTLYNPGQILGGRNMRRAVDQLVKLQVRPAVSDLNRQTQQVQRQSAQVTDRARSYLDSLSARQAELVKASQGITADANTAQATVADQSRQAAMAQQQQADAQVNADADVRGDIARGAAQQLAEHFAANQAGSMAQRQADGTAVATKGGSSDQLAVTQAMASNQRGGEQMTGLADRFAQALGEISEKKKDIVGSKGSLGADILQKLRQQQFENLITTRGLNLDEQELAASTLVDHARVGETKRHNKKMEKSASRAAMLADRKYRLDLKEFGADQAKDNYQREHGLGPYYKPKGSKGSGGDDGGLTPAQRIARENKRNEAWSDVETIAATMGSYGGQMVEVDGKTRKPTREEIFARLREDDNASQDQIIVALALRHKDKIWDQRTLAAARRLGIKVPARLRPNGAANYPTNSGGGGPY